VQTMQLNFINTCNLRSFDKKPKIFMTHWLHTIVFVLFACSNISNYFMIEKYCIYIIVIGEINFDIYYEFV